MTASSCSTAPFHDLGPHARGAIVGAATPDRGLIVLPRGKLVDPATPAWAPFANSWNDLPRDTWMADGGTYRRRRYAAYEVADGQCRRLPHRPHFQDRGYNPLNGGVERWFAPMEQDQPWLPMLDRLIRDTAAAIAHASGQRPHAWSVEAHQFRIEALSGHPGLPHLRACTVTVATGCLSCSSVAATTLAVKAALRMRTGPVCWSTGLSSPVKPCF